MEELSNLIGRMSKEEEIRALAEASDEGNLDETELRERAGEVNALTASVEEDERFVERKERERDGGDPAARQQASLAKSVRAKRDAAVSARDALAARAARAEDEREALESSGEETNDRSLRSSETGHGETHTTTDSTTSGTTRASNVRREYETLKPRLDAANAESATLAPLLRRADRVKRVVLAGDHKQLPAVAFARSEPSRRAFGVSLFERLRVGVGGANAHPSVTLDAQRRMHPSIRSFPSRFFYDARVVDE